MPFPDARDSKTLGKSLGDLTLPFLYIADITWMCRHALIFVGRTTVAGRNHWEHAEVACGGGLHRWKKHQLSPIAVRRSLRGRPSNLGKFENSGGLHQLADALEMSSDEESASAETKTEDFASDAGMTRKP
jgi:hypothetical protein